MWEKHYRICLSAPLGRREGTLFLRETAGAVEGWLEVMGRKNPLAGRLSGDGQIALSGSFRTLISTVQYTATGTVSGRRILLNLKTASGTYYPASGEEFDTDDKIL